MNTARLKQNLIDLIVEEQLKLGFRVERIRFYFPIQSLNALLETDYGIGEMTQALMKFSDETKDFFGDIEISNKGERFCLTLPKQAAIMVHDRISDYPFLAEFIGAIGGHDASLDTILSIFHKYSPHVVIEPSQVPDFDTLVYFSDGIPDDYRYCLTDEGHHIIYHRYTPEDYADLL